ncbi:unnamed protein product [uncultured bacterium]|nr:unnamed protein product [uncultured bacterium]
MSHYSQHLADDTLAIFIFHGVIPEQRHRVRNYTRKHLESSAFAGVLDDLRANGHPVSMNDVIESSHGPASLPPRAFAVTFDDGFRNNLTVAAPMLHERRIPAAFYVTSGWVEQNTIGWIDQIEQAFEAVHTVCLQSSFETLNRAASTPEEKHALLTDIRAAVKFQTAIDPYDFAREVMTTLKYEPSPDPFLDQKMTWSEVAELAADPSHVVGGHGHTHRILAGLSDDELAGELDQCLSLLSRATGKSARHFSYPDGFAGCYSPPVIDALQRRGVECAPTAESGVNAPGADLFRLKRIFVV